MPKLRQGVVLATVCMLATGAASAEVMTVTQLREMLERGDQGDLAATAYMQGVMDGMIGMDALNHNQYGRPFEFCGLQDVQRPVRHPAYRTEELVRAWEVAGYPMEVPVVDLVLSLLH